MTHCVSRKLLLFLNKKLPVFVERHWNENRTNGASLHYNQSSPLNFSYTQTFQIGCIAIHEIPVPRCYRRVLGIDLSWNSQMGERANGRERVTRKRHNGK